MHKLIEELANKSLKSSMVHEGMYRPEGYANGVSKDFADKFAELIVKECADVCINKYAKSDNMSRQSGINFAKDIKEHFGVEE